MGLLRIAREAQETVARERTDHTRAARVLVVRDTGIVLGIVATLVAVSTLASADQVGWIFWLAISPLIAITAAVISSLYHKSTTPEMDRAQSIQLLISAPFAAALTGLIVWAIDGNPERALRVAATAGIGVGVVTVMVYAKSRRR